MSALTYSFSQFALSVLYRHRQQALSQVILRLSLTLTLIGQVILRLTLTLTLTLIGQVVLRLTLTLTLIGQVILRRRLRICQRLNYLERGMHVYYGHRLVTRMFRRWLRYLDTKYTRPPVVWSKSRVDRVDRGRYTYETPHLAEDCQRRFSRMHRFSAWLQRGGGQAAPPAVLYRWMEYTQRRVQRRRIVATCTITRMTRQVRVAFLNMKLELNMYVDKSVTHFLEDRAEWDLRLLDARRCGGVLAADKLRRKSKMLVAERKQKARGDAPA
jgi:hypothetical protein